MNRYLAEGVADDVVTGKRVMVLSSAPRASLDAVMYHLQTSPVKAYLGNGREEIKHPSGGWARFLSTRSTTAGRGMTADVLVLVDGVDQEARENLLPCVNRGEVIE